MDWGKFGKPRKRDIIADLILAVVIVFLIAVASVFIFFKRLIEGTIGGLIFVVKTPGRVVEKRKR